MIIRPALLQDVPSISSIILPVFQEGATYAVNPNISAAEAWEYWSGAGRDVFIAEDDGAILGTYYLKANQAGRGSHVCNCGYITGAQATGKGIARAMCHHSLTTARDRGYLAMQFNFVVSTNDRAIALWKSLGFMIVGRLPRAFAHPTAGFVDAYIMWREI